MDRMRRLIDAIRMLINDEFTGYLRINFSQGSLGRIEKYEELSESSLFSGNGRGTKPEAPKLNP